MHRMDSTSSALASSIDAEQGPSKCMVVVVVVTLVDGEDGLFVAG